MKCPNCSFNNPSSAEICKVCGFELKEKPMRSKPAAEPPAKEPPSNEVAATESHPPESVPTPEPVPEPAPEPAPTFSERETTGESEVTDAVSALFGSDEASPEIYDINLSERPTSSKDYESSYSKPVRVLAMVGAAAVLALFLVILVWPKISDGLFGGDSGEIAGENTPVTDAETEKLEAFFNSFFKDFSNYINDGGLKVVNYFTDVSGAMATLETYGSLGKVVSFTQDSFESLLASDEKKTYEVKTTFYHEADGEALETPIVWTFTLKASGKTYKIERYQTDFKTSQPASPDGDGTSGEDGNTDPDDGSESPAETEDKDTSDQDKDKDQDDDKAPEAETEEPKALPSGYKTSGGFSGGSDVSGLDIASIRYGDNGDFERLVFDFSSVDESGNRTPSEKPATYSASVSGNGKTLTLTVNGMKTLTANSGSIDFKGAKTVQNVALSHDAGAQKATITITLSGEGGFKVFALKEPGKVVVDYVLP